MKIFGIKNEKGEIIGVGRNRIEAWSSAGIYSFKDILTKIDAGYTKVDLEVSEINHAKQDEEAAAHDACGCP